MRIFKFQKLVFSLYAIYIFIAFASYRAEAEEYPQPKVPSDVNDKASGEESIGAIINYRGTNLEEKKYINGNMHKKVENNATQMVGEGFGRQKEYPLDLNNQLLNKANHVMQNPEHYVDWITGEAVEANEQTVQEVKERFTCNEYEEMRKASCIVGQRVEVDAKHQYECLKSLDKFRKVCEKKLNIARKPNCPEGVIQWRTPVKTNFYTTQIVFGKNESKKYIEFEIKDLSLIEEFYFKDSHYIPLSTTVNVNGQEGSKFFSSELSSIQAHKMLKTGLNKISITIPHNGSIIEVEIHIKYKCPIEESWEETCKEEKE